MGKLTNEKNVHQLIADTVLQSSYAPNPNRIGVTTLAGPPLVRQLRFKYHPYLSVDVAEQLWALLGTTAHKVLLDNPKFGWVFETKLTHQLRPEWPTLTGYVDGYNFLTGEVLDFKMTSVWSIIYGIKDGKPDWEQQLNVYGRMIALQGGKVTKLQDVAILRDHNGGEALRNKDYPETPFYNFPSKIWTPQEADEFIQHRFELHTSKACECTPEEKWLKPDTFAVMKGKNKKASKVEALKADAETWISNQKKPEEYRIDVRKGEAGKCLKYCSVRTVCPFSPMYDKGLVKRVHDFEAKNKGK